MIHGTIFSWRDTRTRATASCSNASKPTADRRTPAALNSVEPARRLDVPVALGAGDQRQERQQKPAQNGGRPNQRTATVYRVASRAHSFQNGAGLRSPYPIFGTISIRRASLLRIGRNGFRSTLWLRGRFHRHSTTQFRGSNAISGPQLCAFDRSHKLAAHRFFRLCLSRWLLGGWSLGKCGQSLTALTG